ncbi:MAG: MOSC domain-containing protein [Gemmatimonadota bacterium]|nr:MOSC domain-containing protein [Gemmatimonadota bacterium]MDE3171798.1 MOSC domain-containing protein [Gemmatimonadota bacterium]MDE3215234.1 MOSC domain-containing protein [Gemmatimonadota bacterium]
MVESVNVSDGGVPKRAVERARVTPAGVAGDRQRDLRHHGGEGRALCLYAAELLDALRAEGHPIGAGAAGENLTVRGVPWAAMTVGARFRAGTVEGEITGYAHPCDNLRPYFTDAEFTRISQKLHPGWSRVYARVLRGGEVAPGDAIVVTGGGPEAA